MSNSTMPDHCGESGPNASPRLSRDGQRPTVEVAYAWLVSKLALYLEIDPSEIDSRESFANYGLGSADAVSLSGEMEEWLACEVSPTIVYDYPTVDALARFIARPPLTLEQPTVSGGEPTFTSEPIAIIGMACRFPGESNTPEAFWQLLRQGKDALSVIPAERWDVDAFYDPDPAAHGKMYTRYGCFVQDIDRFDAQFFGIVPREALRMDPQQRLLVEVAWEALENAGLSAHSLAGSQTGVFLGMMNTYEYAQLQIQRDNASSMSYVDDPYFNMGSASSIAAGRVAYLFDLQGPTLTIDTACSSSLVSVHLACQSLRNKECDLAMVGGVNAITLPENMVNACKMGMLAPDGRCKTFDATADGFVLGEGCGMVILKRLSEAVESKDTILAIIRGSAVNQDGHSNGITA
ncbi:MAG: type I polyketide synthase, partial [Ktedonobacteraceae bacterium]